MMPTLSDVIPILAKVTIVLAVVLVVTSLAQRSRAAVRHVFLAAVFAVLLSLPAASFVTPTIRIPMPVSVEWSVMRASSETLTAVESGAPIGTEMTPAPAPKFSLTALLFVGWIIVTTAFLVPAGLGLWQIRVLRKSGTRWPEGQSMLNMLLREASLRRHVAVLLHDRASGPMTCGALRPIIVLPGDAPTWVEDDLRRAITHELEHIRRGDWITQYIARIITAFYWFHPLVWIAWHRLVLEAERACDDAVLRRSEAIAYADQMVALAERLSSHSDRPLPAMARQRDLTMRVRAVLNREQRRGRAGKFCLTLTGFTALLFVVTATLQIDTLAQTPSQLVPMSASRLQFEAAAVRRLSAQQTRDERIPLGLRCRGVDGDIPPQVAQNRQTGPGRGKPLEPAPQGRCTGTVEMWGLLLTAYAPSLSVQFRLMGFPDEFDVTGPTSTLYQIQAVAPNPSRVTTAELQQMLQTLLRDRFKLQVHPETRNVGGFFMTIAKGGIKFKMTSLEEEGCCLLRPQEASGAAPDGGIVPVMIKGNFSMKTLASGLPIPGPDRLYSPPVADKTSLPGVYDITLLLDIVAPLSVGEGRGGGSREPLQFSPPTPKALEEQLGLHLEPAKLPVEFLFIDHLEQPSEN